MIIDTLNLYHGGFSENVRSYLTATVALTLTGLSIMSLDLGGIVKSIGITGNSLPIDIVTSTPIDAPPGNKGVVFKVAGGVVTLYVWDGSVWRS